MEQDPEEYMLEDSVEQEPKEHVLAASWKEDPLFGDVEMFRSFGMEGGDVSAELRLLVLRLGFNRVSKYHSKRVSRPRRDEWCSSVSLYHNDRLLATHTGQAFRSTRAEVVADAA